MNAFPKVIWADFPHTWGNQHYTLTLFHWGDSVLSSPKGDTYGIITFDLMNKMVHNKQAFFNSLVWGEPETDISTDYEGLRMFGLPKDTVITMIVNLEPEKIAPLLETIIFLKDESNKEGYLFYAGVCFHEPLEALLLKILGIVFTKRLHTITVDQCSKCISAVKPYSPLYYEVHMKHLIEILHEDDKENHLIKEEITTKMEQRLVMKKMMKTIFYCLSAPLDEVEVDVVLHNPALI